MRRTVVMPALVDAGRAVHLGPEMEVTGVARRPRNVAKRGVRRGIDAQLARCGHAPAVRPCIRAQRFEERPERVISPDVVLENRDMAGTRKVKVLGPAHVCEPGPVIDAVAEKRAGLDPTVGAVCVARITVIVGEKRRMGGIQQSPHVPVPRLPVVIEQVLIVVDIQPLARGHGGIVRNRRQVQRHKVREGAGRLPVHPGVLHDRRSDAVHVSDADIIQSLDPRNGSCCGVDLGAHGAQCQRKKACPNVHCFLPISARTPCTNVEI